MHATLPRISFIGCGRVGRTLGGLFHSHRVFEIGQILTRHPASAAAAVAFIGAGTPSDWSTLQPADIFVLAVPDTQIETSAQQLAQSEALRPGCLVFHCSGALSSAALKACAEHGTATASAHPLLSFADPARAVAQINAAACRCALEGDTDLLENAFRRIGMRPFMLGTEAKLRYHAAAVIASNYLVTLAEQALQAMESAGVERGLATELLLPLMQQTLDNLRALPPAQALTGPIARGDMDLVRRQYADLAIATPKLAALYAALANATAELADKAPPFPPQG